jgi:hypothetical protein
MVKWNTKQLQKLLKGRLPPPKVGGYEAPVPSGKGDLEFSPLMCHLTIKAIQVAPDMKGAIKRMRILRVRAYQWIESEYGGDYEAFRTDWLVARMGISLQARLLVEQVLWDKGKPWSQLCSGFRPG